jgi:hypothetical protein
MQACKQFRILKYLCKLLNSDNVIIRNVYNVLYDECCKPRFINWLSSFKSLLNDWGLAQSRDTKCELVSKHHQTATCWHVHESSKFTVYKHLIDTWSMHRYLCMPGNPASSRTAILKIRLSSHKLQIECGRYTKTVRTERTCPVCQSSTIEDEHHYILVCPIYSELRLKFIKAYYCVRPSMWKLILLLFNTSQKTMCNLGKLLTKAIQLRDSFTTWCVCMYVYVYLLFVIAATCTLLWAIWLLVNKDKGWLVTRYVLYNIA